MSDKLKFVVALECNAKPGNRQTEVCRTFSEGICSMSVYDSKDLMSYNAAEREFGVPVTTLKMAVAQGSLRSIDQDGAEWLLRPLLEQFVKRTVKRGAGNRVVSRINR
jgi:hypothetical protein